MPYDKVASVLWTGKKSIANTWAWKVCVNLGMSQNFGSHKINLRCVQSWCFVSWDLSLKKGDDQVGTSKNKSWKWKNYHLGDRQLIFQGPVFHWTMSCFMLLLNSVVDVVDGQMMADGKIDHDSIALCRFGVVVTAAGGGELSWAVPAVHSRFLSFIGVSTKGEQRGPQFPWK